MDNLMEQADLDWTNIEPLLEVVGDADPDLEQELREAISDATDTITDIAKRALMEAGAGFDARAEACRARQSRRDDEYDYELDD